MSCVPQSSIHRTRNVTGLMITTRTAPPVLVDDFLIEILWSIDDGCILTFGHFPPRNRASGGQKNRSERIDCAEERNKTRAIQANRRRTRVRKGLVLTIRGMSSRITCHVGETPNVSLTFFTFFVRGAFVPELFTLIRVILIGELFVHIFDICFAQCFNLPYFPVYFSKFKILEC